MLYDGDDIDPLLLSSIALRVSSRLIERHDHHHGRASGGLTRLQVLRVQELVAERLGDPVSRSPSLSELAAEANLSLHHFAREFRRSVGCTPFAYMLRQRLERAYRLLTHTNREPPVRAALRGSGRC
ncbi:helix-turn-helix domain-containing protein [uncultured Enterovirga sp.]|uniref:helix-turn-helix domain-containing protein n=1 Tax=uncultured Enterovirga sp. TaxID=2026352 RepID=UPI0035CC9818